MKLEYYRIPAVFAFLALCVAPFSAAQELTERERELLRVIEDLERRVTELEKAVGGGQISVPVQLVVQEPQGPAAQPNDMRAYWKDGLRFESNDGRFKFGIGGRTQIDHALFDVDDSLKTSPPAPGDSENGIEFRRARLNLRAMIYEDFEFKTQFDFAGGNANFKDVWMAMNNVPYLGTVKAGHFYEPFGMEQLTSDNYMPFMERAMQEVFNPERNTGISASNTALEDRMTWSAGVFRDTDAFGDGQNDGGGMGFTARTTFLPFYDKDNHRLLHVGGSVSLRDPATAVQYAARPESHVTDVKYVDTLAFNADFLQLYNTEIAGAIGPATFQAEAVQAHVNLVGPGRESLSGYYLMGSYILTGEHRPYSKSTGVFGRIRPTNNFSFGEGGGWGAWELALRFSNLDLNDSIIRGGKADNVTLGLNWYMNPNMRMMLNYTASDIEHDNYSGDVNTLQSRFQVNF